MTITTMGLSMPTEEMTKEDRVRNKSMALYLDKLRIKQMNQYPRRSPENKAWTRAGVASRIAKQGVQTDVSTLNRALQGRATEYAPIMVWCAIVGGTPAHLTQIAASGDPLALANTLAQQRWVEIGREQILKRRTDLMDSTTIAQFLDPDVEEVARLFDADPKLKKKIMAVIEAMKD